MNKFLCPHCLVQLNIDGQIILSGHFQSGQRGLILLSEIIGDYTVHFSPDLHIEKGEKIDFHCPSCQTNLAYHKNPDLVRIIKRDESNQEHMLVFSAIFGEHCTYKVSEERTLTYGECAERYTNPEWYLQEVE